MRTFTSLHLIEAFKKKGYTINDGIMEMNIFGVRNSDVTANTFDDCVGIVYKDINGYWNIKQYPATTDPGEYARLNPMNHDGTAIIIPGNYKKVYKIGLHKGKEAMEQIAPIKYVRDANKNKVLDFLYKTTGFKVFNQNGRTDIHSAGIDSKLVDNWSFGCQVVARLSDFLAFMTTVKGQVAYGRKNEFDYTLFEIEDFA